MKASRPLMVSAGILIAFVLAYFGLYRLVYHTGWGFTLMAEQKAPPVVEDTLKRVLEPMRSLEERKELELQQKLLPGEWTTDSGKYRVRVGADYSITAWGLSGHGMQDGEPFASSWSQWGTAGTQSYLSVRSPTDSSPLLEVFVDYEDRELLNVNVVAKDAGFGLGMHRKDAPKLSQP